MNIYAAQRPVLVFGAGAQGSRAKARELADFLQIPVCLTWGAADMFPESDPLRIGTFGTHGTRAANFAVQNADYLLCIGTRLDTKATGTPPEWFARAAHIVMVDIDATEIAKMSKVGIKVEGFSTDAARYMRELMGDKYAKYAPIPCCEWLARCQDWRSRYPAGPGKPYDIIRELSDAAEEGDIIVSDTGCTLAWAMQAWRFKEGQRFLHPWNQTPMGYALPAAVGAHYATGKRVIALCGDGSIMMSLSELATIGQRNLPVKIVLFDNQGHAMCRQTQREWFDGEYPSTSIEGGLTFPDFDWVFNAMRFNFALSIEKLLSDDKPAYLHLRLDPDEDVNPKAKFGYPNENAYPHLPREVMEREMLIPLVGK